ncbi:MAG: hypothetical protein H6705_18515 [Myxococcales bacterium]|nr:hypothetical protein [Myxococcales bacterium]
MGPKFAIFTEDSGADAAATIEALVRRLLPRIESLTQVQNVPRMERPHGDIARAISGLSLKARTPRGEALRRALVDDLATRLVEGQWVILHHDGDVAWGGRCRHDGPVESLLDEVMRRMEVETRPFNVLRLVPHYSIESWLYLNRAAVERLVARGKALPAALEWLAVNASPDGGYDHVHKPKDECPLLDRWNLELASKNWPRDDAAARSPSWARLEADWSANTTLCNALRATNPWATASGP